MNRLSLAATAAAMSLLSACNKSSTPEAPPAATPPPAVQQAVEQAPAATPATAEPIDVCAMLSKEDAEAVLGKLMKDPEPQKAQGSFLGGCNYMSESGVLMMVSARPASEFDGTVKYAGKDEPATEVPGLGEKAFDTKAGVMFQPAGKSYFIVVFGAGGAGAEKSKSLEIAKKVKL